MTPTSTQSHKLIISQRHRTVINDVIDINPVTPLQEIAEFLNEMPQLATCNIEFTADVLIGLGYKEPTGDMYPPVVIGEGGNGQTAVEKIDEPHTPVTIESMRIALERRHTKINRLMDEILTASKNIMNPRLPDIIQKLELADRHVREELIALIDRESPQILPQAVIIYCMVRMGTPLNDIKTIENVA